MNSCYHAYTSLRNMQLVRVLNKNNMISVGSGSSDAINILVFTPLALFCEVSHFGIHHRIVFATSLYKLCIIVFTIKFKTKLKFPSVAFSYQGGISTSTKG